ncbi:hypothetical protein X766_15985 [Mesorhizobium sp. LSJC255A00]|uniref:hypothetical protein n=1 Tax=Mesorhizobium sp. LSJC255A00 TaxID=1287313 RepID=UPI0003CEAF12|nr:hypothetical protein [Mesorhizobium sp. LSJC255A00]ESX17890.1 hypothetical protein X766_15985 [Mesorhizobium sp. LSJC255A00]
MGRKDQSHSHGAMPFDYEVDAAAQLRHQAFGSHSFLDEGFDAFDHEDQMLQANGRLNPVWEMSNAR